MYTAVRQSMAAKVMTALTSWLRVSVEKNRPMLTMPAPTIISPSVKLSSGR